MQVGLLGRGAALYHLCLTVALPAAWWPWQDAQQQVAQPRGAAAAAGGCEFGRMAAATASKGSVAVVLFVCRPIHVAQPPVAVFHQHAAFCRAVSHAFGGKERSPR